MLKIISSDTITKEEFRLGLSRLCKHYIASYPSDKFSEAISGVLTELTKSISFHVSFVVNFTHKDVSIQEKEPYRSQGVKIITNAIENQTKELIKLKV